MTLPNDVSRCINAECPRRWTCQRWMDRPIVARHGVPHTLFEHENCQHYKEFNPKMERVIYQLRASHGNIKLAAQMLGIHRNTLYRWMESWGVKP